MITVTLKPTAVRRALAVAGAVVAMAITTVTVAAPAGDAAPSVAVRYDDLNLADPAGVNALYRRIAHAARQVCPDVYSRDLNVVSAGERCQAAAVARAVSDVHDTQLALVHAARTSHG